jgi:hypothetical protein
VLRLPGLKLRSGSAGFRLGLRSRQLEVSETDALGGLLSLEDGDFDGSSSLSDSQSRRMPKAGVGQAEPARLPAHKPGQVRPIAQAPAYGPLRNPELLSQG